MLKLAQENRCVHMLFLGPFTETQLHACLGTSFAQETYTFAVAIVVSQAVQMLSWAYSYVKYLDQWKPTLFAPLVGHLVIFLYDSSSSILSLKCCRR